MKKAILFLIGIVIMSGCAEKKDSDFQTELYNPEQTNQTSIGIISVESAKELVLRHIIDSGYGLTNGWILKENPYLTNIQWGPVVFVENIGTEGRHKYYYIFYGKMPDGAMAINQAVDAVSGDLFVGGLINYNETNKTFLLTQEEAKKYATINAGISKNVNVKAVFYRDWSTMNYDETFCWKYQIMNSDQSTLSIKGNVVDSIFLDPYVVGSDPVPTARNVANRYFTTRIYALEPSTLIKQSMYTKGSIETNKRFISVE